MEAKLLKALEHALQRLNAIPHRYDDTNFRLIEEAIKEAKESLEGNSRKPIELALSVRRIEPRPGGLFAVTMSNKHGDRLRVMGISRTDKETVIGGIGSRPIVSIG
jgi:hypothetical protein